MGLECMPMPLKAFLRKIFKCILISLKSYLKLLKHCLIFKRTIKVLWGILWVDMELSRFILKIQKNMFLAQLLRRFVIQLNLLIYN